MPTVSRMSLAAINYQWVRVDDGTETEITSATSSIYTTVSGDARP